MMLEPSGVEIIRNHEMNMLIKNSNYKIATGGFDQRKLPPLVLLILHISVFHGYPIVKNTPDNYIDALLLSQKVY